jgi:hypothetical protein
MPMLAVALLATSSIAAEAPVPDSEPVQAVWKDAQIDFTYIGRTSFYSCDSLEYKVARILKDIGAREDLKVRANGCSTLFAPDRFMSVRITLAIPVVLEAAEGLAPDEKSRRELVARVRGEDAPDFEVVEQFPASWKRVKFSRKSRFLDDGDCELVEQLQTRVFKKLDIRVIREDNWCIPGRINFGQLNLEVETLVALPKPDTTG